MDIQSRKIYIVQELLKLQNEDIISAFEKLLKKEKNKLDTEDFKAMSIEELNNRIDKSMKDSSDNNVINNKKLISEIKRWN